MDNIETFRNMLSADDTALLKSIREPKVVAVSPSNAGRDLCVMSDGEIRCYGTMGKKEHEDEGKRIYISSCDCGLSWKTFFALENEQAMAPAFSSDKYVCIVEDQGIFVIIFENGKARRKKITDKKIVNIRLPMQLRERKRLISMGETVVDGIQHPVVLYSDDDGESWCYTILESAPKHEVKPPHKGIRWQNGSCEPTVVELDGGTLMMLARTSQDYFYIYHSYDSGESWTEPKQSDFHATLTMPTLLRLKDGRIVLFWCNTQPLPELDHTTQRPSLNEDEINGVSEDVFTNRDANHAAISDDDGRTWKGFREIFLNTIRNNADFRSNGDLESYDKSVHQFQAIELPFGKILLNFGQNISSRKIVIFDVDWLYESKREEDFRFGLDNISTQVYLKSVSGNSRGFTGHCAWNRTNGAVLVPDPEENFEEALLISRIHDERLFSEVQGAVWNFPASHKGELNIKMRIVRCGLHISLTDRWFNPIDTSVRDLSQLSFKVTKDMLPPNQWTMLKIIWDASSGKADIYADNVHLFMVGLCYDVPHGFSYLHLQGLADEHDVCGSLIKSLQMIQLI